MTVTRTAQIDVRLASVRAALQAVQPHRSKVKTGDDEAMYRLRLVFSAGQLYVMATNGSTAALAKAGLFKDSRGALGKLDPDDAPMIVDLQPRRIPLILQQFKPNQAESAEHQLIRFDVNLDPADPVIDLTDIGGLWSEGESLRFPIESPAEAFPDVMTIVAKAMQTGASDPKSKDLVTDPKVLALFAAAGKAYDQPVRIRPCGSPQDRGFLVTCGPDFVAAIESKHGDDGGTKARDQALVDWLNLIKPNKLVAV